MEAPEAAQAVASVSIGACRINLYSTTELVPYIQIYVPAGEHVSLEGMALYEGSYTAQSLPDYTPRGYADELHECQRYYLPFRAGVPVGVGYTYVAGTTGLLFIPTPVTMHANPQVTSSRGAIRCGGVSIAITLTSATAYAGGVNLEFALDVAASSESGAIYMQNAFALDAEL